MITRELEQQAEALFEAAVELDAEARRGLLAEIVDAQLRQRVQLLLDVYDAGDTGDLFQPLFPEQLPPSLVGESIGPYRIVSLLGEGGMGQVYLAERADVGLRVALKLVRDGRLASPGARERFLLERRILARLEHPCITRLHDAGLTESGVPWLVMEYVQGEAIDAYARRHSLTTEQRIELFLQVCDAVAYAHRASIVHRDLKPANILVTEQGHVWLVDFGVAKLLASAAEDAPPELTRVGRVPLTPEYASPEQVRGEPVTTASDLYSLGIILYELLTGARPYRLPLGSAAEIERTVCNTLPVPPSHAAGERQLARRLRGDLDTIVLKALAKEPERRYHSAQELADDLRRHLAGQPVRARPDSVRYLAGKYLARNRIAVGAGALVLAALAVAAAFALRQRLEAMRQRELALASATTMVFELADGLSRMTGPTEARLGLLTQATEIFEAVGRAGGSSREGRSRVADGYRTLAQTYRVLGEGSRARSFAERAERLARELAGGRRAGARDRLVHADALLELGDGVTGEGEHARAAATFGEAVTLVTGLATAAADSGRLHRVQYLALSRLGDRLLEEQGAADSAATLYRSAERAAARLLARDSNVAQSWTFYATTLERRADMEYYAARIGEGCALYRTARDAREHASALAPGDPAARRALAVSLQNVGWCEQQAGAVGAALARYAQANELLRELLRDDRSNVPTAILLMGGIGESGNALRGERRLAQAIAAYREATALGEEYLARGVSEARITWKTVQLGQLLADALVESGALAAAERTLGRSRLLLDGLRAHAPDNIEYLRSLGELLGTESELGHSRGDVAGALAPARESLESWRRVAEQTRQSQDRQRLAHARYVYARGLLASGRQGEAAEQLRAAERLLLELRTAGELPPESDGARRYLPAIQAALADLVA